jgi:hypothetical protein
MDDGTVKDKLHGCRFAFIVLENEWCSLVGRQSCFSAELVYNKKESNK